MRQKRMDWMKLLWKIGCELAGYCFPLFEYREWTQIINMAKIDHIEHFYYSGLYGPKMQELIFTESVAYWMNGGYAYAVWSDGHRYARMTTQNFEQWSCQKWKIIEENDIAMLWLIKLNMEIMYHTSIHCAYICGRTIFFYLQRTWGLKWKLSYRFHFHCNID